AVCFSVHCLHLFIGAKVLHSELTSASDIEPLWRFLVLLLGTHTRTFTSPVSRALSWSPAASARPTGQLFQAVQQYITFRSIKLQAYSFSVRKVRSLVSTLTVSLTRPACMYMQISVGTFRVGGSICSSKT